MEENKKGKKREGVIKNLQRKPGRFKFITQASRLFSRDFLKGRSSASGKSMGKLKSGPYL
ncbi:hypothetical protein [Methanosarcina sp.]|uniref:hypothetical protein n=1 Tax=Methanosarcina sp. TaxID=2213 RepID=UPI002ABB9359|nr:hypothetical protein [Methanosarcina sp.]MDY9925257.1 hypothetical protein [Methanosarcina sp.]